VTVHVVRPACGEFIERVEGTKQYNPARQFQWQTGRRMFCGGIGISSFI
jgi:hypothetical protein